MSEENPVNLEDLISPEPGEVTIHSIWAQVCKNNDIILVIDKVDLPKLRKQLSNIKSKENAKLKDAALPPDQSTLEFVLHKDEALEKTGQVKVQIFLKQQPAIKVHKMVVANGDL